MESTARVSQASRPKPEPFITCQPNDYVGFATNAKLWPLFQTVESECLLFADKVKKFRSCGWK